MMRLGGSRRPWAGLLPALLSGSLFMVSACTGPSPDTALCTGATIDAVDTISTKLLVDGELRHARSVQPASGGVYVSAELLPADKPDDFDGDILTWFSDDPSGRDFVAVDVKARDSSSWPAASFDVREEGAIDSRGCVLQVRGNPVDDCGPGFQDFC